MPFSLRKQHVSNLWQRHQAIRRGPATKNQRSSTSRSTRHIAWVRCGITLCAGPRNFANPRNITALTLSLDAVSRPSDLGVRCAELSAGSFKKALLSAGFFIQLGDKAHIDKVFGLHV